MATLVKANNLTALSLAGSWTPSQVPTAADSLVINTTYNSSTGSTIPTGGNVTASSFLLSNITNPVALSLGASGSSTASTYLITLASIQITGSYGVTFFDAMTSPTGSLSLILRNSSSFPFTFAPTDTNISITFPLSTTTPFFYILAAGATPTSVNVRLLAQGLSATILPTQDAVIQLSGAPTAASTLNAGWSYVVVQGHPTLPTTVTINQTAVSTATTFAPAYTASYYNPNSIAGISPGVSAVEEATNGEIYFGGTWTTGYIGRWSPTTETWWPIQLGQNGQVNAIRQANGNNIYFGGSFTSVGAFSNSAGILRYDSVTQELFILGNGFTSGIVRAIAYDSVSGKIYVGGSFSWADSSAVTMNNIGVYNPATNTWAAMGTGVGSGTVYAVEVVGTKVYVGGQLTTVSGAAATSCVYSWDTGTSTWAALPSSPFAQANTANAFTYDSAGTRLFVGHTSGVGVYNTTTAVASNYTTGISVSVTGIAWRNSTSILYFTTAVTGIYYSTPDGTTLTQLNTQNLPTSGVLKLTTNRLYIGGSSGFVWDTTPTVNINSKVYGGSAYWDLNTNTWQQTIMAPSIFPANTLLSSSLPSAVFIGTGTAPPTNPVASFYGGQGVYTVSPNTTFTILVAGRVGIPVITVRRGGAINELPTLSAQPSIQSRFALNNPLKLIGSNITTSTFELYTTPVGPNAGSSVKNLRVEGDTVYTTFYGPTWVYNGFNLVNFKATEVNARYIDQSGNWYSFIHGNITTALFKNQIQISDVSTTWTSQYGSNVAGAMAFVTPLAPNWLQGTPRSLGTTISLAKNLVVGTPYFRIYNAQLDRATATDPNTALVLNTTARVIEVPSNFNPLFIGVSQITQQIKGLDIVNASIVGAPGSGAEYVYSQPGPLTLTTPFASGVSIAFESNTGPITIQSPLHPRFFGRSTVGNFSFWNGQINNWDAVDFYSTDSLLTRGNLGFMGPATVRITRSTSAFVYISYGLTLLVDFSDINSPTNNILFSGVSSALNVSNNATVQFKGKPGADNVQYFVGSVNAASVGDGYIVLDANGANSLTVTANLFTSSSSSGCLYISGLAANAILTARALANTATTPIIRAGSGATVAPCLVITGPSGFGDFVAGSRTNYVAQSTVAAYTALPTSGGVGGTSGTIYQLTGGQSMVGNFTCYAARVIQSTSSDTLNIGTTSFSFYQFLLTGNQGGTYTIGGTMMGGSTNFFGGAIANPMISNVSNAELRIGVSLNYTTSIILSGPGTIALGTPTVTYRSNASTATTAVVANCPLKIYAGTDNFQPYFGSGSSYAPTITVSKTLLLTGSGTGRYLFATVALRANAKLQIDADWTVTSVSVNTFTGSTLLQAKGYAEVNTPAGTTLTVTNNTSGVGPITKIRKTGTGKVVFWNPPLASSTFTLWSIEEGSLEFQVIAKNYRVTQNSGPAPFEILSGASIVLNSAINHRFGSVIWGAGSITKQNTNTVEVRSQMSFTGGLTIAAGEYNAQYRFAVGDGNVTVSGGTLRASAVNEDQYVLEIAGNLVFSGGALAIGAAYVA